MELRALQALLGRNIRVARKAVGWTQEDLTGQIGLGQDYVSKLEGGQKNPTLATLLKLADALKVQPADLLKSDELDEHS